MRIVCVLKLGGDFEAAHAERLRSQVLRFAPGADFTCLTDCPETLRERWALPLADGLPGWWSKIEVFKLSGPLLYLDLDTTIVRPLDPIFAAMKPIDRFIVLRDFNPDQRLMGSGVMAWAGRMRSIYSRFHEIGAEKVMSECSTPQRWGDQAFIESATEAHSGVKRVFWQDVAPGAVVSFKKHVQRTGLPDEACIVAFHGNPRPWQVPPVVAA